MKIKNTILFNSFKGLAFIGVIVLMTASCKSKKAVADLGQQIPIEENTPLVEEPEPEPEVVKAPEVKLPSAEERLTSSLNSYFSGIANASSTSSANSSIQEALRLFGGSDTPVLIIFYAANGQEDFDEPTTISKYLNYLKDQGKNPHKVKELVLNAQGKVKELVLVKK